MYIVKVFNVEVCENFIKGRIACFIILRVDKRNLKFENLKLKMTHKKIDTCKTIEQCYTPIMYTWIQSVSDKLITDKQLKVVIYP